MDFHLPDERSNLKQIHLITRIPEIIPYNHGRGSVIIEEWGKVRNYCL